MTTTQIILTIIEFLAVCLVIVGMYNETKIAKWERRVIKKVLKSIIRAYDKRQEKKLVSIEHRKGSPKIVYSNYNIPAEQHYVA